jgi:glycerol-3-phosphate O-acyltransferase
MEGFTDLLEDIKKLGGPLMWISQKKEFLENATLHRKKRSPEQLKQDVLQSPRLRYVIDQIVAKSNLAEMAAAAAKKNLKTNASKSTLPQVDANSDLNKSLFKLKQEDVQNEAKVILDEMAHQFDLKYVRVLGYLLMKVFARIFQHIYYNVDMNENLQVMKHYPTLMLPLHRSYMDFLLVSIICFHKNVQLPAVAAGQDFLGKQMIHILV